MPTPRPLSFPEIHGKAWRVIQEILREELPDLDNSLTSFIIGRIMLDLEYNDLLVMPDSPPNAQTALWEVLGVADGWEDAVLDDPDSFQDEISVAIGEIRSAAEKGLKVV